MTDEKELDAEYMRLLRMSESVLKPIRDAFNMISIIPRIYDRDDPENRILAGAVLDMKFRSCEESQYPDPRLIVLLEKMIGRNLLRYPENEKADITSHHAFYAVQM